MERSFRPARGAEATPLACPTQAPRADLLTETRRKRDGNETEMRRKRQIIMALALAALTARAETVYFSESGKCVPAITNPKPSKKLPA